jgi:hypothetical protein
VNDVVACVLARMEELLELESAGWTSLCDGTASEFYGSIMTADALMVLANGQVMDRGQVVEALRDAPRWASFSIDSPRVVRIGDAATALVYTGTGRRETGPEGHGTQFVGAMTSVYVRTGDGWKLALYQQTQIA